LIEPVNRQDPASAKFNRTGIALITGSNTIGRHGTFYLPRGEKDFSSPHTVPQRSPRRSPRFFKEHAFLGVEVGKTGQIIRPAGK
jgi:hypothetical protein